MTTRARPLLAAISCLGLAACGGIDVNANIPDLSGGGGSAAGSGGGSGTTPGGTTGGTTTGGGTAPLGIVQLSDGRILAGSAAIAAGDYTGRTFPIQFAVAVDDVPQASVSAGFGTIEVVDADTLILTFQGQPPIPLSRSGANEFTDGAVTFTRDDIGAAQYLFLSDGAPEASILVSYGFETPAALRPVSARYGATSAASLHFAAGSSSEALRVAGAGTVDLTATFTGSGGTVTGVLIDGQETIDFDNVGGANDRIFVRTTLDGTITEGGFTGTVDGSAAVSIAGGPVQDLNLVLSNSAATGKFFGMAAETASGVYAADATYTPPGLTAETGSLSGFFLATTQ